MKTNFLKSVLLLALAFFTFSCSDDEETSKHPIEATWIFVSEQSLNCHEEGFNSTDIYSCTEQECQRVRFSNGNAITLITFDGSEAEDDSTPYTISGNEITLMETTFNFVIANNQLVLTLDGESYPCDYIFTFTKDI